MRTSVKMGTRADVIGLLTSSMTKTAISAIMIEMTRSATESLPISRLPISLLTARITR
jgi:hypothetical protein